MVSRFGIFYIISRESDILDVKESYLHDPNIHEASKKKKLMNVYITQSKGTLLQGN